MHSSTFTIQLLSHVTLLHFMLQCRQCVMAREMTKVHEEVSL